MPQRWAMVAQSNTCEICLKHGKQVPCWIAQKPSGALPCGENGCVEIHHPLLHEQRGWHGLQGTLWENVKPEEVQLLGETMVEQDVSVGELHTQDHTAFSSVEPINENGEIVPFLLIDGSAPSSIFEKKMINENVESFSIEENDENVESKIVKTEIEENEKSNNDSEESSKPNVVDAVGSGAVCIAGAGAETDDESDSEDEIFEDAYYYDSDSEYINTAQDLDKIVMLCQTVTIQKENVNVCYDYGAAFSMLNEKKANVALLKGKGHQVCGVVPGVPIEERTRDAQTMPLDTILIPLAGGGVGAANVYILSEELPPMSTYPLPSEVAQVFNLPLSDFARRGGGAVELFLGADNIQYFPCRVGRKNNKV
jgi:hypothetical protein